MRGVRGDIVLYEFEPILDGLGSTVETRNEMGRKKNAYFSELFMNPSLSEKGPKRVLFMMPAQNNTPAPPC